MSDPSGGNAFFGYAQNVPASSPFTTDPRSVQYAWQAMLANSSTATPTQGPTGPSAEASVSGGPEAAPGAWTMAAPQLWGDAARSVGSRGSAPAHGTSQHGTTTTPSPHGGFAAPGLYQHGHGQYGGGMPSTAQSPGMGHPFMQTPAAFGSTTAIHGMQQQQGLHGMQTPQFGFMPAMQQGFSYGGGAAAPDPSVLAGLFSQLAAVQDHGVAIQRLQEMIGDNFAPHDQLATVLDNQHRHGEVLEGMAGSQAALVQSAADIAEIKDVTRTLSKATSEIHAHANIIPTFSTAHEAIINMLIEQKATMSSLRTRLDDMSTLKASMESAVSSLKAVQASIMTPLEEISRNIKTIVFSVEASTATSKKAAAGVQERLTAIETSLAAMRDATELVLKPDSSLLVPLEGVPTSAPVGGAPSTPARGKGAKPERKPTAATAGTNGEAAKQGKRKGKKEKADKSTKALEHLSGEGAVPSAPSTPSPAHPGALASPSGAPAASPSVAASPFTEMPTSPATVHPPSSVPQIPPRPMMPQPGQQGYMPMDLAWMQRQQLAHAQRAMMMNAAMQQMALQQRLQAAAVANAMAATGEFNKTAAEPPFHDDGADDADGSSDGSGDEPTDSEGEHEVVEHVTR